MNQMNISETLELKEQCKIKLETKSTTNTEFLNDGSSFELTDIKRKERISTSSKYLDGLFEGGGVPLGKLTEICGNSGCGKSKLCFQLAINVQSPDLNGECIFIDTEGSFQLRSILPDNSNSNNMKFLDKIHLFRVLSHAELSALIHQLPNILIAYPKVKLIIIDSIAYHFRLNTLDPGKRPVILKHIAQTLVKIAKSHNLAVVMTNHVTRNSDDGPWIPSLGPLWGKFFSNRLFLYNHKGSGMFGYLYKSCYEQQEQVKEEENGVSGKTVQFCITNAGISDPGYDQLVHPKAIEQHEIDQKMKETWVDILSDINKKKKTKEQEESQREEQNPELDSVWDEEHMPDQLISEIPSQMIVYEYDDEDLNSINSERIEIPTTTTTKSLIDNTMANVNDDDNDDDNDVTPNYIPSSPISSLSPPSSPPIIAVEEEEAEDQYEDDIFDDGDRSLLLTLIGEYDNASSVTYIEDELECSNFENRALLIQKRKRSQIDCKDEDEDEDQYDNGNDNGNDDTVKGYLMICNKNEKDLEFLENF